MLLLHGALGAAAQFDELAGCLSVTGAVHRFDFHGHGSSPLPMERLTMECLTSQLAEFIETRGLQGVPCFGYSMGGYVALVVAATRPGLLGAVATLATKLTWTPESAAREISQLDPETISAKVPKFAAVLDARHTAAGWRALCSATAGMLRDLGARPLIDAALLASTPIPVRLMVGDRDQTVTIEETVAGYRALPNGELAVLPGMPHPLERVPVEVLVRHLTMAGGKPA